jgi:hypothetical protein
MVNFVKDEVCGCSVAGRLKVQYFSPRHVLSALISNARPRGKNSVIFVRHTEKKAIKENKILHTVLILHSCYRAS